ncbi:4-oxalocrotonate tautomerase [Kordiimonas pumila]|uniref:Tautomerase n=1 Tax=Kordiimonas pumila TaxID=2161677 RepID=A0ABV7D6R1_9PROT|nr:4-oxalocrotonate tautomerase [Kordiimonas pumila]
MPIVNISILEGRDDAAKARLIAEVTDAVEHSIGASREAIRVLINEIPASHWGTAGVPKSQNNQNKK